MGSTGWIYSQFQFVWTNRRSRNKYDLFVSLTPICSYILKWCVYFWYNDLFACCWWLVVCIQTYKDTPFFDHCISSLQLMFFPTDGIVAPEKRFSLSSLTSWPMSTSGWRRSWWVHLLHPVHICICYCVCICICNFRHWQLRTLYTCTWRHERQQTQR